MTIRPNPAKRRLAAGLPVVAPNLGPNSIPDLDMLEYLCSQGLLDAAWIEMEHGPWTWADLSNASRACDLWGTTSLVRVTENNPTLIGRVLDRGIQGVLVPHVNTRADAERAVRGAYYAPLGKRGMFLSRQSFGVDDYLHRANDEVMVIVLIEDVVAISNLDQILEVDGIDCYFVARSDLSQSMGAEYLGRAHGPEVQGLIKDTIKRIVSAGRQAGAIVDDTTVQEYLDIGARFLRTHGVPYLEAGLRTFRDRANRTVGGGATTPNEADK
jgi:2-keto-3-deoxy-L-rhamnonate aldolase RhmA